MYSCLGLRFYFKFLLLKNSYFFAEKFWGYCNQRTLLGGCLYKSRDGIKNETGRFLARLYM